jgi:hypothetical protein
VFRSPERLTSWAITMCRSTIDSISSRLAL